MKRYFKNPEIKKSTVAFLIIIGIFCIITIVMLNAQENNLKEAYSKTLGAVAEKVSAKDPDLGKTIIPLITKELSVEDAKSGEAFIMQYGLDRNLNSALFPYMNNFGVNMNYILLIMVAFLMVSILSLNYFQLGFFYSRIRKLNLVAEKVLEGNYDVSIDQQREGDLSKLYNSFTSMRNIIKNNISDLKAEKQFLLDLLSDISHQLKTPLSSMIVYNDILLTKEVSKEQRHTFLINSKNQLNRMEGLIKSLLKLAKLDARAIVFDKMEQSLKDTIEESIWEGANVKFICEQEIYFNHDRMWLTEALNNIIKNAREHTTKDGCINIRLIENPIYKRIIVEDNGEGISQEDLPHIFKRFYKAKTSKKSNSIGIGLALAKAIIEGHNGIIEVKSKLGVGTKFTITFLNE